MSNALKISKLLEAKERRQRPRTAPSFPGRKGAKLVEGLTKAELIQKFSPMVKIIALKMARNLPQSVDKDDLISTGYIGLMDAADKFDATRAVKFQTYAEFRIRGAMLDELRKQDWVPRSVRTLAKDMEKAMVAVQTKKGRAPTEREVSRKLGLTLDNYHQMKKEIGSLTLLNFEQAGAFSNPDQLSYEETIESAHFPDPFAEMQRKDTREILEQLLSELPEPERIVLSCYYFRGLNLKEISTILNLTESRICQLHTRAIRKLKDQLRESGQAPLAKNLFLLLLAP